MNNDVFEKVRTMACRLSNALQMKLQVDYLTSMGRYLVTGEDSFCVQRVVKGGWPDGRDVSVTMPVALAVVASYADPKGDSLFLLIKVKRGLYLTAYTEVGYGGMVHVSIVELPKEFISSSDVRSKLYGLTGDQIEKRIESGVRARFVYSNTEKKWSSADGVDHLDIGQPAGAEEALGTATGSDQNPSPV